ncbi:MAG: response regulator [Acidobacteria bacterium]|nr:response regulator [Acidobacteriota bacterium]
MRRTLLEEAGHRVTTASTPEQGLAEFAKTQFDLVITDYRMPNLNGVEVIAKIREATPEMKIILISAFVEALGLTEQNTGADAVVPKNNTEVVHLVRTVDRLTRRSPRKPNARAAAKKKAAVK